MVTARGLAVFTFSFHDPLKATETGVDNGFMHDL